MNLFNNLGHAVMAFFRASGEMIHLLAEMVYWCKDAPRSTHRIAAQSLEIGVRTFPLTALMAFFVGMVLAVQSVSALERYGSTDFLGGLVALSLVKELAPVLTALLVAGRVGSAMAAELATMQVNEEIPSLTSLGINPVRFLAMPRFLASTFCLPILTIFSSLVGVLGGGIVAETYLNQPFSVYFERVRINIEAEDLRQAMVKALCFGAIIAMVGCHQGFRTRGGAEQVGQSTTRSVVISSILVIICDYFISRFSL